MPDCELHRVTGTDQNVDVIPVEEWYAKAGDIGAIFADFLARRLGRSYDERAGQSW